MPSLHQTPNQLASTRFSTDILVWVQLKAECDWMQIAYWRSKGKKQGDRSSLCGMMQEGAETKMKATREVPTICNGDQFHYNLMGVVHNASWHCLLSG
jgi:hypothetical protein